MSLTYFANIYIPPLWPQSYQSLLPRSLLSTNSKLQTNQTQQKGLRSNIFQRRESNKWKQKHHKHHKHCHLCRAFESYIASQRDVCPEYINICAQQSGGVNICCPPYSYFSVYLGHYLGWRPGEPCAGPLGPDRDAAAPGTFIVDIRDTRTKSHTSHFSENTQQHHKDILET